MGFDGIEVLDGADEVAGLCCRPKMGENVFAKPGREPAGELKLLMTGADFA